MRIALCVLAAVSSGLMALVTTEPVTCTLWITAAFLWTFAAGIAIGASIAELDSK